MKIWKIGLLSAVVALALISCYWTPPETGGSLNLVISIQSRDLPVDYYGYFLRVELFRPGDISTSRVFDFYE